MGDFRSRVKVDEGLFLKVFHGLSARNYRACAEVRPEAFSFSLSTVSRRYIRASSKKLQELQERRLDAYEFVALIIDGKRFGEDEITIAAGITTDGRKVVLGMVHAATENSAVCREFLSELIEMELRYEEGLLCVVDGAKGMSKAISDVFNNKVIVQRCQWHKRENVVSYLPKNQQEKYRKKLQDAYNEDSYEGAKEAFLAIKKQLRTINESAVKSLEEGFEETLTIQRLGMYRKLKRSFATTNILESIMSLIGQKTDMVDYWKTSNQKQRWLQRLCFI